MSPAPLRKRKFNYFNTLWQFALHARRPSFKIFGLERASQIVFPAIAMNVVLQLGSPIPVPFSSEDTFLTVDSVMRDDLIPHSGFIAPGARSWND